MTRFTKMHGLGNDFVVFDAIHQSLRLEPARIQRLADRHVGVGCDQVLLVEASDRSEMDFRYRIFNADGGEVEQCGNGLRCFARFVHEHSLTDKTEIHVETRGGDTVAYLEDEGLVKVDMGEPEFDPARIPFEPSGKEQNDFGEYELELVNETVLVLVLSMGNPHAVQLVQDIKQAPVAEWGPLIERHSRFPRRVNAGFMQVLDRKHIAVRVYERGVGETLACGTGACAAVVAGRQMGLLDERVNVLLNGGQLDICWQGTGHSVWLTGPATTVFEGSINLDGL